MKIYFTASLTGKAQYGANYQTILSEIKELGHSLVTTNVIDRTSKDVMEESADQAGEYYRRMIGWIKKADLVVAEVSYPSTGIGYEISLALQEGKPVIALYVGNRLPYLLESTHVDRLQVVEYNLEELKDVLKYAVEEAKNQLDVRFNFFVSPKIVRFLDWVAKKKKMPRAVYLRRLIEEDMKRSKDFSEE